MSWELTGLANKRPFTIQHAGTTYTAASVKEIFRAIELTARKSGGLLDYEWREEVWKSLHSSYPQYVRKVPKKRKKLLGVDVVQAKVFLNFLKRRGLDRSVVSVEEASRRAAICRECPQRRKVAGCPRCKAALKAMVRIPEDVNAPEGCHACGCYLPAKVFIPIEQLRDEEALKAFPFDEKCWMLEGN